MKRLHQHKRKHCHIIHQTSRNLQEDLKIFLNNEIKKPSDHDPTSQLVTHIKKDNLSFKKKSRRNFL